MTYCNLYDRYAQTNGKICSTFRLPIAIVGWFDRLQSDCNQKYILTVKRMAIVCHFGPVSSSLQWKVQRQPFSPPASLTNAKGLEEMGA